MDLEVSMASLQLSDAGASTSAYSELSGSPPEKLRRSSRTKSVPVYSDKRRVLSKPTKKPQDNPAQDIENLYLDKRSKRLNPLETIYEEVRQIQGEEVYMSKKKFKRAITFAPKNLKTKKAKMKVKHASASQRKQDKEKLPMQYLLEKLSELNDQ